MIFFFFLNSEYRQPHRSEMNTLEDEVVRNTKHFLASLKNSSWALTASEKTIDSLFDCALKLEQIFLQEDVTKLKDFLLRNFPNFNLDKPVDVLLENIIKNNNLGEHLTLYAIQKYNFMYSKDCLSQVLEKILSEVQLRQQLFVLIEDFPDVDLDFLSLNNLLHELINSSDSKLKIQNALKSNTWVFLNAIKHSDFFSCQTVMDEMIQCLESQTDLRLWFLLLKQENLEIVLELCDMYNDFLNAILKFFDKFADEIESNYDEELNVLYSHVNLDFEDFVKVIQLFLKKQSIKKEMSEYLESKTLTNKNFCFWVDVKSCL